jgi:ATP-dependent Clp protease adaptor protein ClpS
LARAWPFIIIERMAQEGQQVVVDVEAKPADKPRPVEPRNKPRNLPPFKVLLHNDDVNSVDHVIASILRLTNLAPEEALLRTLEAHHTGVALLLTTHRERAELYIDQFASLQLTTTAEPAE